MSRDELADEQSDLGGEVTAVFRQIQRPRRTASAQLRSRSDRVEQADALSRGARLVCRDAAVRRWARSAAELLEAVSTDQRRHAKELKDLAAALRTPPADRLDRPQGRAGEGREGHRRPDQGEQRHRARSRRRRPKARRNRPDPKMVTRQRTRQPADQGRVRRPRCPQGRRAGRSGGRRQL